MPRERNNIKVISISSLFFSLEKKINQRCLPFLSWDNNYFRFVDGDLTADYEGSLPTKGISVFISNNKIKLPSLKKKCVHVCVCVCRVGEGVHCGDQAGWGENVVGQLVMLAATTNISKVVDMEAVRAAILSCQRFTALYLCSPKLSGLSLVCAASGVFTGLKPFSLLEENYLLFYYLLCF